MAAWDKRLTIGLICGGAAMQAFEQAAKDKILFADLGPVFATHWWNYGPAALVVLAGVFWLVGRVAPHDEPVAGRAKLRPLIEAFEMHAAKEHVLSGECGPGNSNAGKAVPTSARDYLRGLLEKMGDAARNLNLAATDAAVKVAIRHFNTPLDTGTAYAQYRGVTQALLEEIDGRRQIPSARRKLGVGILALVAAGVVAFSFLAPSKTRQFGINEIQKQKLEATLDAWPSKFPVLIFFNQQNEPSAEYAEALFNIFRGKNWPAFLSRESATERTRRRTKPQDESP